jgi:hypothetical protein
VAGIQTSILPADTVSLMETDPWAAADAADRLPDPEPAPARDLAAETGADLETAEAPADPDAPKKRPARRSSARKAPAPTRKAPAKTGKAPARARKKKETPSADGE